MAEYNNRLDSLVVIPTLRCELECDHCCRCSSPRRTEKMDQRVLNAIWSMMPDWVCEITISGGEPFIDMGLLIETASALPETSSLYIATNGVWAKDQEKRYKFFSDVLPELKKNLEPHADLGLVIDLSQDQYHRWQEDVSYSWKQLKYESENGISDEDVELPEEPIEDDFDNEEEYNDAYWEWEDECVEIMDSAYVYPDMEHVSISERGEFMNRVLPIGRGQSWATYDENDKEYCHFDGNGRIENQLTIWPDGRVSACCDGGAWVGNVLTQDLPTIMRQRRSFLFWLRRKTGTYLNGKHGVPTRTCEKCKKLGKEYFGTTFKEE